MKWMEKRFGLALGGGGVRGISRIGVLKVLEQEELNINRKLQLWRYTNGASKNEQGCYDLRFFHNKCRCRP